jgi:glycosyltransferase involved in cell wall biosynthesis
MFKNSHSDGSFLVSVCVITYNHEKFIRQCLEGIMMQETAFPFEVVIGDDCSTDNTRLIIQEFVEKYPDVIKPVYQPVNVGGARNAYEFCYPKLTGKYIAVCEGDDYWTEPSKLQRQVDFLELNPEYVFCFHRVNGIDEDNSVISEQAVSENPVLYNWKAIFHLSIPTLSVVFRKCFDTIPPEMFNVKSGDTFLFGLLSKYGDAADLGFSGGVYRKHKGGVFSPKSQFEQFRQSLETRRLMRNCSAFRKEQKTEIAREIAKRKLLYFKFFLKKIELANCLKIILV